MFFDDLPLDDVLAALNRSPGNEIESGKLASPESSAALAVNTFGWFLDKPERLPPIPNTEDFGWPANRITLEECVRFPWSGGTHPWLVAFVETQTHIIGIESKRYEPFRSKAKGTFSEAYWRPVWGEHMEPIERMRDRLRDGALKFQRLDAVQLVKHAFGLVTEAGRCNKKAALVYLYAEPQAWAGGRPVDRNTCEMHSKEVEQFAALVTGASVLFRACTYRQMLATFEMSVDHNVQRHGCRIVERFKP